jgi:hypothetical protein
MPQMTDPGEYAHTSDGINQAEALASHTLEHMVSMTEVARLDTVIASLFLLAEVLAGLESFAGISAKDAVKQVKHMTAERVAAIAADMDGSACPLDGGAQAAEVRVLH